MRLNPKILPIRVLKIWFDVVLVVSGAACAAGLLWLLVSPFVMARGDAPVDAVIWAAIGQRSLSPIFELDYTLTTDGESLGLQQLRLVKTEGEVKFLTTEWWLHFVSVGGVLFAALLVFYVIWSIRQVLKNALAGDPFAESNGRYLRRAGWIVLLAGVLWPVFTYVQSRYVLARVEVTSLDLSPALALDQDPFIVGLLFLVFAAILNHGHRLAVERERLAADQELTI